MTSSRAVRALITAASLLLLAAGCARSGGGSGGPDGTGGPGGTGTSGGAGGAGETYGANQLVLRVEYTGGFVTPATLATRLPIISVYGDGRVIDQGPQILIYPAPALPNVQVRHIKRADVRELVNRARNAGIGGPKIDYGQPPIADAPSTRFTVAAGGRVDVVEVYALGEAGGIEQGLTDEQVRARAALRGLLNALNDLPATLGAGAVSEPTAYRPSALAAVATPWVADPQAPDQQALTWPGPALPGKSIGAGLGCVDVRGNDTPKVLAAAEKANMNTPWISRGKRWTVTLRPLLPDEPGCPALWPSSTPR